MSQSFCQIKKCLLFQENSQHIPMKIMRNFHGKIEKNWNFLEFFSIFIRRIKKFLVYAYKSNGLQINKSLQKQKSYWQYFSAKPSFAYSSRRNWIHNPNVHKFPKNNKFANITNIFYVSFSGKGNAANSLGSSCVDKFGSSLLSLPCNKPRVMQTAAFINLRLIYKIYIVIYASNLCNLSEEIMENKFNENLI